MKQKKSKIIYYVFGIVILVGLFYVATHQIPLKTEHVEQVLENDFLEK
ncbi:MAG: hypothetical protein IJ545_05460 [Alphaproteobacteria bacterium]|nr:hypothetical protein [Alphaproteobacteria bacterium]